MVVPGKDVFETELEKFTECRRLGRWGRDAGQRDCQRAVFGVEHLFADLLAVLQYSKVLPVAARQVSEESRDNTQSVAGDGPEILADVHDITIVGLDLLAS